MTTIPHIQYLEGLEQIAASGAVDDFYLWPRTPIGAIQTKIRQRVGATDYQVEAPTSRPAMIIKFLQELSRRNLLRRDFSALDIACGDGVVLWQIQKTFPDSACYGVDCNKGAFPAHSMVESSGVRLYKAYIQHLFKNDVGQPFDIVLMLNSYRDWKAADLRGHELDLPELANRWFERNGIYAILTAEREARDQLRRMGFSIRTLGKGEDRSSLFCATKAKLPSWFLSNALKKWANGNV